MKKPMAPPDFNFSHVIQDIFGEDPQLPSVFENSGSEIFATDTRLAPSPMTEKGEYIHWDKLRHLHPPDGVAAKQQWQQLKLGRITRQHLAPFADARGRQFWFCHLGELEQFQHWVDKHAAGVWGEEAPAAFNKERRARFLLKGLKEEAIHSSILEGATTPPVAARKILAQKNPRAANISERMIINNYRAMQFVQKMRAEHLTMPMVLELHRVLMEGAIEPGEAGRMRQHDNIVVMDSSDGTVLHRPPAAATVDAQMTALCDFANGKTPQAFIHPAIRAIILHFMIGFIHPFTDGNGRTARALFYWAMGNNGYWMTPFVSISEVILRAPVQYARAFLLTETDSNDMTYFLLHQTAIIQKAFAHLDDHVKKETVHIRGDKSEIGIAGVFNHRQIAILHYAEEHPDASFSVYEHQANHNVSYPTALNDLRVLVRKDIFSRRQTGGKEYIYALRDGARKCLAAARYKRFTHSQS